MIRLNGELLNIGEFPNGEKNYDMVQLLNIINNRDLEVPMEMQFKFEGNESLMDLFFVKSFIDDYLDETDETILFVSYMPYSRMDRENDEYLFTLKYVANFINSLNFLEVIIAEPHSVKTLELVEDSYQQDTTMFVFEAALDEIERDLPIALVFPDAGAKARYGNEDFVGAIEDMFGQKTVVANKTRDFKTGQIQSITIDEADNSREPFTAVVLDDLCSKGGTFMGVAAELKRIGAADIHLVVAHCEETIFDGAVLREDSPVTSVWTTDSIMNKYGHVAKLFQDSGKLNIIKTFD